MTCISESLKRKNDSQREPHLALTPTKQHLKNESEHNNLISIHSVLKKGGKAGNPHMGTDSTF